MPDRSRWETEYKRFVEDLKVAINSRHGRP
jgi:hypothetical protein